jgi:hypothetical protein
MDHSEAELLAMNNPFALVVLATQKVLAKQRELAALKKKNQVADKQVQNEQLNEQRLAIARVFISLAKDQYTHEQVVQFLVFLRGFIYIPNREINLNFNRQIDLITGKSNTMGIWEIVAEEAMEKGIKKGESKERRRSRIEIEKSKAETEKKSKAEVVKNLLSANRFTIAEIATFASVSENFVEEVKKTLN